MMIESIHNAKIKKLHKLITKNNERKKSGTFAVEGIQENERAITFGYIPEEFFICPDIFTGINPKGKIWKVSEKIYSKIAYRKTTEGIIGIYQEKKHILDDLKIKKDDAIIIVESLEKPGNLGAILRSCEAFGIKALIITNSKVDFYNPNVIRSSMGCLFGMNIFNCSNHEIFKFLQDHDFQIFTTILCEDSTFIYDEKLSEKIALVFGTEHSGLSNFWKKKGKNILIPMNGTIDSLNLSNSVAISCYEILKQKQMSYPTAGHIF